MDPQINQEETLDAAYQYAANLLINENLDHDEVIRLLEEQGMEYDSAKSVVSDLNNQILLAKKEQAKKDILYGALWCGGGIIATMADFGYIFYGAIIFGGIQLVRGLIRS